MAPQSSAKKGLPALAGTHAGVDELDIFRIQGSVLFANFRQLRLYLSLIHIYTGFPLTYGIYLSRIGDTIRNELSTALLRHGNKFFFKGIKINIACLLYTSRCV